MAKKEQNTEATADIMWTIRDMYIDGEMRIVPVLLQKVKTTFYVNGVFDRDEDNWIEVPGTINVMDAMAAYCRRKKGNGT